MKAYDTDRIGSTIAIGDFNTHIAMTINGRIVLVKIPSNDIKVVYGDAFCEDDTLADWLARNVKDLLEMGRSCKHEKEDG